MGDNLLRNQLEPFIGVSAGEIPLSRFDFYRVRDRGYGSAIYMSAILPRRDMLHSVLPVRTNPLGFEVISLVRQQMSQ